MLINSGIMNYIFNINEIIIKSNSSSLAGLFLLKVFDVILRSLVRMHLQIAVSVTQLL